ncbi:MAG: tetratricopeptide repeat protein [Nitrospinae bacterium]|nr:tetratricopeptide repeat protein [Nitrospinota bacterium]
MASVPRTPEPPAQTADENTPAGQRDLAEQQARAGRWDEAVAHWKRAIEMDPMLREEIEAALGDAFLKASAAALAEGHEADAHAWLLDAVAWLPERGDIRQRLAERLFALRAYREAIDQYRVAFALLPLNTTDLSTAVVRVYREWGNALLRQGDFAAAASVFREALQLSSDNGEIYFALGKAEFRQRAIGAAIQAFEAAQALDPGLWPEVEPYWTKARALLGGPQAVVIDFPPGMTRIEVPVVINGRVEVPFIIDTGATMTLMPARAAEMLGYRPQAPSEWLSIQTASGPRRLPYTFVARLEVQGLGLSNLPVLFGDLPGYDMGKGLLGMDFLRHFSLAVDHEIGRLTLRPK